MSPCVLEQPAGVALVVGQREQEELAGDELVAALGRLLVGEVEQVAEIARNADLAALALDLGQALDRLAERLLQLGDRDARAREQRRGAAVLLVEHRRQQVLRLDEAVVVAERQALRVGERLLELGRQFVETHAIAPRSGLAMSEMGSCAADSSASARWRGRRIAGGTAAGAAGRARRGHPVARRARAAGNNGGPCLPRAPARRSPAESQSPIESWRLRWRRLTRWRATSRHPDRQGDGALPSSGSPSSAPRRRRGWRWTRSASSSRLLAPPANPEPPMPTADVVDLSRLQFAVDGALPLPVRPADARAVVDPGHHGIGVRDDRQGDLPRHDEVLGEALRHQFRDGRHHRHHDGVPVRHQLGVLLALRRRHLRRAAGARGADGVLPRVDVRRPVLLRLGPAVEGASTCW